MSDKPKRVKNYRSSSCIGCENGHNPQPEDSENGKTVWWRGGTACKEKEQR